MKILDELYYGNIRPNGKLHCSDPSFNELVGLCEKIRGELLASFNDEEKELFEKYTHAQAELDDFTCREKFSAGFKLGVMLTAEAYEGAEGIGRFYA